jgi:hypothetical protein
LEHNSGLQKDVGLDNFVKVSSNPPSELDQTVVESEVTNANNATYADAAF